MNHLRLSKEPDMITRDELVKADKERQEACLRLVRLLNEAYPIGTEGHVYLQSGQTNGSPCVIWDGANWRGELRVKLTDSKANAIRSVLWIDFYPQTKEPKP